MANNADISDMQKDILEGCKNVMDEVNTPDSCLISATTSHCFNYSRDIVISVFTCFSDIKDNFFNSEFLDILTIILLKYCDFGI